MGSHGITYGVELSELTMESSLSINRVVNRRKGNSALKRCLSRIYEKQCGDIRNILYTRVLIRHYIISLSQLYRMLYCYILMKIHICSLCIQRGSSQKIKGKKFVRKKIDNHSLIHYIFQLARIQRESNAHNCFLKCSENKHCIRPSQIISDSL